STVGSRRSSGATTRTTSSGETRTSRRRRVHRRFASLVLVDGGHVAASGPASDGARVQDAPVRRDKRDPSLASPQPEAEGAVVGVVREGEAGVGGVEAIEAVAAGTCDELDDPLTRVKALRVVLVTAQDERGVAGQRVPKRGDVGCVSVHQAGAVARAMPKGQPAGSASPAMAPKPAVLSGAGPVVDLRVAADDLPAGDVERVVAGNWLPGRLLPVRVVAAGGLRPVVVTRCGSGHAGQVAVERGIAAGELLGGL